MDEVLVQRRPVVRPAAVLFAWGLPGVLSLLLLPLPETLGAANAELAAMPWLAVRLLSLLNPLVLLLVAAWVGACLAHRVGLGSLLAGTARTAGNRRTWWQAAGAGWLTGVVIVGLDHAAAPWLGEAWQRFVAQAAQPDARALLAGLLYGGITEEVVMRWGLMSLLAWGLWRLGGRRAASWPILVAIGVSALVFGAGHLPALGVQVDLTTGIVVRTVLMNALAALVFGWMFWRHHLEAAMLAHASAHVGMWAATALSGGVA